MAAATPLAPTRCQPLAARACSQPTRSQRQLVVRAQQQRQQRAPIAQLGAKLLGAAAAAAVLLGGDAGLAPAAFANDKIAEFPTSGLIFKVRDSRAGRWRWHHACWRGVVWRAVQPAAAPCASAPNWPSQPVQPAPAAGCRTRSRSFRWRTTRVSAGPCGAWQGRCVAGSLEQAAAPQLALLRQSAQPRPDLPALH